MYKICVYAIAKNESENVEKWFESMKTADHIVVLDTGSTDDTVEKLRSFGIEVHEKHYDNFRFDTARNDCLDLVPDEYDILVSVDLDERFEQKNWTDIIKENWDPNKPRMIYDYVWIHTTTNEPGLTFWINKIHKKDPNLRWIGAVHEHLWYLKENTRTILPEECVLLTEGKLVLHHYPDINKSRAFYLQLLIERLEESPEDEISWVLVANEYRVQGQPEKAIEYYEHCLNNFKDAYDLGTLACIYYWLGFCCAEIGEAVRAWVSFAEGIAVLPMYRDNYYGLAVLMTENGLLDMALGTILQAFNITQRLYNWLEDPNTWTFLLYDLLSQIYFMQGEYNLAFQNIEIALRMEPTDPVLIEKYNYCKQVLEESSKES